MTAVLSYDTLRHIGETLRRTLVDVFVERAVHVVLHTLVVVAVRELVTGGGTLTGRRH